MRLAPLLLLPFMAGCAIDVCSEHEPAFELEVTVDDDIEAPVESFSVQLRWDDNAFSRHFVVGDALSDGVTTVGVDLVPAPLDEIELSTEVIGRAGAEESSQVIGRGRSKNEISPNGCNIISVKIDELEDS